MSGLLSSPRVLAISVAVTALGWVGYQWWKPVSAATAVPSYVVTRGEFRSSHFEAGEIRAISGEEILSPRVSGQLQIVHLWPEGERVDVGDLILQFETAEFEKWVKDEASQLEKARADMSKAVAEQQQRDIELRLAVEQSLASLELAKINLQRAELAPPIDKEQSEIRLKQAERAVIDARTALEAQKTVNEVQRTRQELLIGQSEKRYEKALKDFNRLSVRATRPGIVVYEKIRKRGGDRRGKVTKGDVVWGGVTLLTLPDLTAMQVITQVGEMDVEHVKVGQKAFIRLEAFPGPVFHGQVATVAPMAQEAEDAPNVQIFEMVVDIEEQDERLYPGMSASVEIVLQTFPDVLQIPVSALEETEQGNAPRVYRLDGDRYEPVAVVVSARSGMSAVIASGLEEGDTIALHADLLDTPPAHDMTDI